MYPHKFTRILLADVQNRAGHGDTEPRNRSLISLYVCASTCVSLSVSLSRVGATQQAIGTGRVGGGHS